MKIIICDADKSILEGFKAHIQGVLKTSGYEAKIETYESGERLLFEMSDEPNEVDVLFINTHFNGKMDGIEVISRLREIGYVGEVIFVTDERDRVFESFRVHPYNYFIKGEITETDFAKNLMDAADKAYDKKRERVTFACAGDVRSIPVDSIRYFEETSRIIEVHYDDEVFEFFTGLDKLENQLFGKGFVRVHKHFLVNEAHIVNVRNKELVLDNEETVPVSSQYLKHLKQRKSEEKPSE